MTSDLKEFTYNGKKYQYKVVNTEYSTYTHIFDGVKIETCKKFKFFGPIIKKEVPNYIFRIYLNMESPSTSKKTIKEHLASGFKLVKRAQEIKQGKIL
jgi:hypothetical protein